MRCNKNERKFHPGHYVAVGPSFDLSTINYLEEPNIKGVNKRYNWRTLEPQKGEYDFSSIEEDLDFLASHNKQLIVFLVDRSYWIKGAMPAYLKEYEMDYDDGGFCPIRWHPEVVSRIIALGDAIGKHFDKHPNFEGLAIPETSLDLSKDDYRRFNYTPEKYRDALIKILRGLNNALPTSRVFWYQNFMEQNNGHLYQVADSIANSGIVMGGPDILPYRIGIRSTYRIYDKFKDKLTLFCSAQDDSYKHHKNDTTLWQKEPIHEEGLVSMEEIFLYARDSLHVRYLFWNYYYEETPSSGRSYNEAIDVIRNNPDFNYEFGPSEN